MQAALALEKSVNQSLLDLHGTAGKHSDPQVRTGGRVGGVRKCFFGSFPAINRIIIQFVMIPKNFGCWKMILSEGVKFLVSNY